MLELKVIVFILPFEIGTHIRAILIGAAGSAGAPEAMIMLILMVAAVAADIPIPHWSISVHLDR